MKSSKTGLAVALFYLVSAGRAITSLFKTRKQGQAQDSSAVSATETPANTLDSVAPDALVVVARVMPTTKPVPKAKKVEVKAPPAPTPAPPVAPACPHCKQTMVMKVARSGANAGGHFWGCTGYPKCRGMRAIFAPLPSKRG